MKPFHSKTKFERLLKSLTVIIDYGESRSEHITAFFDTENVPYIIQDLDYGEYSCVLPSCSELGISSDTYFTNELFITRKSSLDELAADLTTGKKLFREEMKRTADVRKYLIVEEGGGYTAILDHQYNCKLTEKSFFNSVLRCQTQYGINVIFCKMEKTADIIYGLLIGHVYSWLSGGENDEQKS